jgi:hypothetical protein
MLGKIFETSEDENTQLFSSRVIRHLLISKESMEAFDLPLLKSSLVLKLKTEKLAKLVEILLSLLQIQNNGMLT